VRGSRWGFWSALGLGKRRMILGEEGRNGRWLFVGRGENLVLYAHVRFEGQRRSITEGVPCILVR
jgi:hypothetical protein